MDVKYSFQEGYSILLLTLEEPFKNFRELLISHFRKARLGEGQRESWDWHLNAFLSKFCKGEMNSECQ